jgi:hypothetical protein
VTGVDVPSGRACLLSPRDDDHRDPDDRFTEDPMRAANGQGGYQVTGSEIGPRIEILAGNLSFAFWVNRSDGRRRLTSSSTMRASSRANGAPRQLCTPTPNERCSRAFGRRISKRSGSMKTAGSRFADASKVLLRRRPPSESGASGDSAMMWTRRSCPLIDNGHYRRCRTPGCKARMAASAGEEFPLRQWVYLRAVNNFQFSHSDEVHFEQRMISPPVLQRCC